MATPVDPEIKVFWRKVREAYMMVSTDHDRHVTEVIGGREFVVAWDDADFVKIHIRDVETSSPKLIVPSEL